MFECNRDNRPIASQDNIHKVMEISGYSFGFIEGNIIPVMFANGKPITSHEQKFLMVWERCLALDFFVRGLEKAVRYAVYSKLNEC